MNTTLLTKFSVVVENIVIFHKNICDGLLIFFVNELINIFQFFNFNL